MPSFDWKTFFRQHPIFSSLADGEIERLLDPAVSRERDVPKGETIVREGDLGASLFVIGTGATNIRVSGPGGTQIPLVTLQGGEFFGEMALLQHMPRAATVTAAEQTLLREIQGEPFLQILQRHPDTEFRMLLVLSERLRRVGQHVVALAHKDVDKKLQAFDAKLDAALKQFDTRLEADLKTANASLVASQTVFEQTSKRADEVISSAERRQANQSRVFAAIGTAASVLVGIAGFFGISAYKDIQEISQLSQTTKEQAASVTQMVDRVKTDVATIQSNAEKINAQADSIDDINKVLSTTIRVVLNGEFGRMVKGDSTDATRIFEVVTQFGTDDAKQQIFSQIARGVLSGTERTGFRRFIKRTIDSQDAIAPDDRIILYSYLLAAMVLDRQLGDYELEFPNFTKFVQYHRGEHLTDRLKSSFDPEWFKTYIDNMNPAASSDADKTALKQKIDAIVSEVAGA